MAIDWPRASYDDWSATCDTLHAHTQVLGKLAVALAPPEPQLQHAALRLTARGWETLPLPAPDGSGALVVALDLRAPRGGRRAQRRRRARVAAHARPAGRRGDARAAGGRRASSPAPSRSTRRRRRCRGRRRSTRTRSTRPTTPTQVASYFAAATQAALVLAAFRAPYRGRSTPVNAWWGSFDLAVNLFSGQPAEPPSDDFIMRNAMDAQEVAVGWWPGDPRYRKAAFYAYAHPAPDGFAGADAAPAGRALGADARRVHPRLGRRRRRPPIRTRVALEFARSAFRHACLVCDWDPALAASAEGRRRRSADLGHGGAAGAVRERAGARSGRLRQLLRAAPRDRRRRRRHDRADVAVGRLVEIDDHRRVIARAGALARLAVDPRRARPGRRPARSRARGRCACRGPGGTCRRGSPSR